MELENTMGLFVDVSLQNELEKLRSLGLLDYLLLDRTTKNNVLWGTDAYQKRGIKYERDREIRPELITGKNIDVIRNCVQKKSIRLTRKNRAHTEHFLPGWLCQKMNDESDNGWFYQKNAHPFGRQEEIKFLRSKKWTRYVDSKVLELACGEAPYLVSRYDALSGENIPLKDRQGLLERKLRIIAENTDTEAAWWEWVVRAYQSTYGYELQGDKLLIARLNLLMTFEEALEKRWERTPTLEEYGRLIRIITWNIWQMDGLTLRVPYLKAESENMMQTLDFGMEYSEDGDEPEKPFCKIFNWRENNSIEFSRLKETGLRIMKFDFVVGCPPYQEKTPKKQSISSGEAAGKNIFHYFQLQTDEITRRAALIYPAGRWIHRSGRGMKEFGLAQINDRHLEKVILYSDSLDIFPTSVIADGVSIVVKNYTKEIGGFAYQYVKNGETISVSMENPGKNLMSFNPKDTAILAKLTSKVKEYNLQYLHDAILPRSLYGIESDFVARNPEKIRPFISDSDVDFTSEIKLLTNDKAGKGGRARWFVTARNTIQQGLEYVSEWQVVVSSANAGGQKRDNQLEIIDNHSAYGRSRVGLRSFKNADVARNFYDYVQSYVARYAFLLTDEALTSLGKRVPDFVDYSGENTLIDFSADINAQLYKLFDFSEEEIKYIEFRVDNIRGHK